MSGIPVSTLTKWYYPGSDSKNKAVKYNRIGSPEKLKKLEVVTAFPTTSIQVGKPRIFRKPEDLRNACAVERQLYFPGDDN